MNKKTIREWGENTAHSAKGHFKSADFYKSSMKWLISINILFAAFSVMDFGDSDFVTSVTRFLALISFTASVLILMRQAQEDKNIVRQHMDVGEEYLNIYYDLQRLYNQETASNTEFDEVAEKISKLNLKSKPIINQFAKRMASRAIEKKGEMIIWWQPETETSKEE